MDPINGAIDRNRRPVLLAMCNPHSVRPEHALYPYPPGCSGWRLWKLLESRTGATHEDYLRAFDRVNLVPLREWDEEVARRRAPGMLREMEGREVVVLGTRVRAALGVPPLLVHPQDHAGATYRQLPHPSGRCLWYNDPENRRIAAVLLEELYVRWRT